jgi:hypothetical protein
MRLAVNDGRVGGVVYAGRVGVGNVDCVDGGVFQTLFVLARAG